MVSERIHDFPAIQSGCFDGGNQKIHSIVGICGIRIGLFMKFGAIAGLKI